VESKPRCKWAPPLHRSDLTVVIPTWNGKDMLRNCLHSLENGSRKCTILVVDDGSTDKTEEMVWCEFPEAGLISIPENSGFANAANQGLLRIKTPYAALLNNDTEVNSEWVANILAGISRYPEAGFFASRIVNYYQPEILDSAGDVYLRSGLPLKRGNGLSSGSFPEDQPVLAASAGASVYRTEALRKTGLLDGSFHMYLEDVDLSLRLQSAGFPCMYLAGATVRHREAASDPDRAGNKTSMAFYSSNRVYWITRNRWLLMVSWQPMRNLPWLLWGWFKSFFFHLLKAGFTREFLKGIKDGIVNTPQAWRKRSEIRRNSLVPLKKLCKLYKK
jgi:GT2 family glycosyltransferase